MEVGKEPKIKKFRLTISNPPMTAECEEKDGTWRMLPCIEIDPKKVEYECALCSKKMTFKHITSDKCYTGDLTSKKDNIIYRHFMCCELCYNFQILWKELKDSLFGLCIKEIIKKNIAIDSLSIPTDLQEKISDIKKKLSIGECPCLLEK